MQYSFLLFRQIMEDGILGLQEDLSQVIRTALCQIGLGQDQYAAIKGDKEEILFLEDALKHIIREMLCMLSLLHFHAFRIKNDLYLPGFDLAQPVQQHFGGLVKTLFAAAFHRPAAQP